MTAFIAQNMAPIMFASLVVFLLLGYPVAFSLGAVGLAFFFIGVELAPYSAGNISLDWPLLSALPERIYGVMNNETLLAIPFFTFMGLILERSGMAEDLLDTIGQLFGPVRGGLAFAVIFVGALLAATTGVVAASVISMGLISLPIMLRYGYDRRLAAGVIAASGTLAQIIPPSLVLIVMADQLGRSVGDMYKGAFIPGIVLSLMYAGYVFLIAVFKPEAAPALPLEARSIPENETYARRQGVTTAVALLLFGVPLFYFLIWLGVALANAVGLDVVAPSEGVRLMMAGALSLIAFGRKLFGSELSKQSSPRVNTLAVVGFGILLGLLFAGLIRQQQPEMAPDNLAIWAAFAATGTLYALALLNKATGASLMANMTQQVIIVLVPPLALIFLVLGTIFVGIATPTEGGAMGAAGGLLLALSKGRLNLALLKQAMDSTLKLSAFVVFILIGARVFSLTFYGVNGHTWVEHLLTSLPGGQTGFLVFVNILVFVLAFFLDFFELAFIIVPLLGPAADKLGIDLIWFGVILGVNMQTSFMHPPFGFALFYLRSVAPKEPYTDRLTKKLTAPVTTGQIYMGAIPFVIIQCIMVAMVIAIPQMVMHYKAGAIQLNQQQIDDQFKNIAPPPAMDEPPALKF
ncbi:MAG: C4-dicarboxylate transporter [Hyphomicrobiales bacterium]|nr:C4-dicarboxylate transporter [Hyphomicrobiales bacterium]